MRGESVIGYYEPYPEAYTMAYSDAEINGWIDYSFQVAAERRRAIRFAAALTFYYMLYNQQEAVPDNVSIPLDLDEASMFDDFMSALGVEEPARPVVLPLAPCQARRQQHYPDGRCQASTRRFRTKRLTQTCTCRFCFGSEAGLDFRGGGQITSHRHGEIGMDFNVDALLQDLIHLIEQLGRNGGLISPSVYDTAQVLRLYPPKEGVEPGLEWLLSQQQADGGWGTPTVPLHRDMPTLAAVLALDTYSDRVQSADAVDAGLEFLRRQSGQWDSATTG